MVTIYETNRENLVQLTSFVALKLKTLLKRFCVSGGLFAYFFVCLEALPLICRTMTTSYLLITSYFTQKNNFMFNFSALSRRQRLFAMVGRPTFEPDVRCSGNLFILVIRCFNLFRFSRHCLSCFSIARQVIDDTCKKKPAPKSWANWTFTH